MRGCTQIVYRLGYGAAVILEKTEGVVTIMNGLPVNLFLDSVAELIM